MKYIWVAAFALMLGGCAGMRLQDEAAGSTRVNIKGCETAAGEPYICEINLVDGKARKDVELTAKRGDIEVHYSAKEATVDGQAIRAMVHGAMIAAFSETLPQVMSLMMQLQAGGFVPPVAPGTVVESAE